MTGKGEGLQCVQSGSPEAACGFLFIGDPHVWSRKPGRRLDADFCATVCSKLSACVTIANEERLVPVILGDLFEDETDSDPGMLSQVARAMMSSWIRPVCLVGNHDKKQKVLTEDTALWLLGEVGALRLCVRSGPIGTFRMGDCVVLLGGTPYDFPIPKDVGDLRSSAGAEKVVWVCHHDLAFQGAYPGAAPIEEIGSVDDLVNGHMHKHAPSVAAGKMRAHNPGNITRMSIDCASQEPRAWVWTPTSEGLSPRPLPFEKDRFDLSGTLLAEETIPKKGLVAEIAYESLFAKKLLQSEVDDRQKADDAVFLREDLMALLEIENASLGARAALVELLEDAIR